MTSLLPLPSGFSAAPVAQQWLDLLRKVPDSLELTELSRTLEKVTVARGQEGTVLPFQNAEADGTMTVQTLAADVQLLSLPSGRWLHEDDVDFFVRPDTLKMFNLLEGHRGVYPAGCMIVSGTPGIGKTYFSNLCLLCWLTDPALKGRPIVVHNAITGKISVFAAGKGYAFPQDPTLRGALKTLLEQDSSALYLEDTGGVDVAHIWRVAGFAVVTASIGVEDQEELLKEDATDRRVYAPPSLPELLAMSARLQATSPLHRDLSPEETISRVAELGYNSRYALASPGAFDKHRQELAKAISKIRLDQIVQDGPRIRLIESNLKAYRQQYLLHMYPDPDTEGRSYRVQLGSPGIELRVADKLFELSEGRALALLADTLRAGGGEAGGLRGAMYETAVRRQLGRGGVFELTAIPTAGPPVPRSE